MLPDSLIPYIAIVIVIFTGIIVVVVIRRRNRTKLPFTERDLLGEKPGHHMEYRPGIKPVLSVTQKSIPRQVQKPGVLPQPGNTSVTEGQPDITASFHTLTEKYSLEQFTLATADGLVFASSGGEDAQQDAAEFSRIYTTGPVAKIPGVMIFGIDHKGSALVGIIRTRLQVPDEVFRMIENDTKDILKKWI